MRLECTSSCIHDLFFSCQTLMEKPLLLDDIAASGLCSTCVCWSSIGSTLARYTNEQKSDPLWERVKFEFNSYLHILNYFWQNYQFKILDNFQKKSFFSQLLKRADVWHLCSCNIFLQSLGLNVMGHWTVGGVSQHFWVSQSSGQLILPVQGQHGHIRTRNQKTCRLQR